MSSDFLMLFTANWASLLRSSTTRTDPNPPWPSSLPILYFDSMDLLGKPQSRLVGGGIGAASQTSTRAIALLRSEGSGTKHVRNSTLQSTQCVASTFMKLYHAAHSTSAEVPQAAQGCCSYQSPRSSPLSELHTAVRIFVGRAGRSAARVEMVVSQRCPHDP